MRRDAPAPRTAVEFPCVIEIGVRSRPAEENQLFASGVVSHRRAQPRGRSRPLSLQPEATLGRDPRRSTTDAFAE